MGNENGTWIMYGLDADDPACIHTADELLKFINEIGFLPLFKNEIEGFSVEEHTIPGDWWCGEPAIDPWEWRTIIAASGKAVYGKFFDKKAGFISKKWLPYFANYRRDGYDFEGVITSLQMSLYLCVRDFERKINRKGEPYGWPVAVYSLPEHLWCEEHLMKAFGEDPSKSHERIIKHIKKYYPNAMEKDLRKI